MRFSWYRVSCNLLKRREYAQVQLPPPPPTSIIMNPPASRAGVFVLVTLADDSLSSGGDGVRALRGVSSHREGGASVATASARIDPTGRPDAYHRHPGHPHVGSGVARRRNSSVRRGNQSAAHQCALRGRDHHPCRQYPRRPRLRDRGRPRLERRVGKHLPLAWQCRAPDRPLAECRTGDQGNVLCHAEHRRQRVCRRDCAQWIELPLLAGFSRADRKRPGTGARRHSRRHSCRRLRSRRIQQRLQDPPRLAEPLERADLRKGRVPPGGRAGISVRSEHLLHDDDGNDVDESTTW